MGSFSSTPKILNDDSQDNDIQMPINFSRYELIQYCQTQPQVHPMVKRAFRKVGESNVDSYGFKFRKLNALTKGCSDYVSSPYSLRIFQWNILSQGES
jgi:CheY-like chemotaxis protein